MEKKIKKSKNEKKFLFVYVFIYRRTLKFSVCLFAITR